MVDGLDLPFGPGAALVHAQVRVLDVVVDEQRVVDLEQEAGVDDGPVFHPEGVRDGEQELLVALVVLVLLVAGHVAGGDGGHEGLRSSGFLHRGLQVRQILHHALLGLVGDGAGAGHLHVAGVGLGSRHRAVVAVVLRERLRLAGVVPGRHPHPARGCQAVEPLVRVDRESALAELAVVDDVDAEVHLPAHDVVDRAQELLLVVGRIHRPALVLRQHHVDKLARTRQAAGMGDKNAFGAVQHGVPPMMACFVV